jgi:hypothetical protein
MPVQQNCFKHRRVLLWLTDRGIFFYLFRVEFRVLGLGFLGFLRLYYVLLVYYYLLLLYMYSRRQSTVCTTYYSDIITCSYSTYIADGKVQFVLHVTRILLLAPIIYSRRQSTVCTTYYSDIITCSHCIQQTAKYSCDCTVATMMIWWWWWW